MPVRLSFGTAGIRAPVGEGDDQLNPRTVRVVAHALVDYALEQIPGASAQGVCLAFDGREHSAAFASEVAGVALARGFSVRMFDATRQPTIRREKASTMKHTYAIPDLVGT